MSISVKRYKYSAFGLMAALILGTFLPKADMIKNYINAFPVNALALYWCALALVIYFLLPRVHMPGFLRLQGQMKGVAFSGAIIFLTIRFGTGFLLKSIAMNSYDLSPLGILSNLFDFIPMILVREMIRAYALGTAYLSTHRSKKVWVVIITIIFWLFEVNFSKILTLDDTEKWFIFIAKDVLPFGLQSCLLTALVLYGDYMASIIYIGAIGIFARVFPFLPTLPWIAESALGISFPIIMLLLVLGWYKSLVYRQAPRKRENILGFTIALGASVMFSWFVVGVFPMYPSVILTGSMEPGIMPGDIVIIKKISHQDEIYNLNVDEIINFKMEDITVTHRIIEVLFDDIGNISFRTKGDNNKSPDSSEVLPPDINGTIENIVPKVGMPVIWMYTNNPTPEGVVDY